MLHVLNRLLIKTKRRIAVTRRLWETQDKRVRQKLLPYIWIPFARGEAPAKITVSKFGRQAAFHPHDYYDLEVWNDIFHFDDYADHLNLNPRVIFDLGAHIGLSAIYYHLKYPRARIFCFEADPDNFQALSRNVAPLENVRAFNYAISGRDEQVRLYVHPRSVSHSVVERASGQRFVDVEGRRLDTLMKELSLDKVDLIKFNIEGVELDVFRNFERRHVVQGYVGHLHLDLIEGSKENFLALFDGYNVVLRPTKPMRYKFYARKKSVNSVPSDARK